MRTDDVAVEIRNPMGIGTIDEHFIGIRMGIGWQFMGMGIKVLGMGNDFPCMTKLIMSQFTFGF